MKNTNYKPHFTKTIQDIERLWAFIFTTLKNINQIRLFWRHCFRSCGEDYDYLSAKAASHPSLLLMRSREAGGCVEVTALFPCRGLVFNLASCGSLTLNHISQMSRYHVLNEAVCLFHLTLTITVWMLLMCVCPDACSSTVLRDPCTVTRMPVYDTTIMQQGRM